MLDIKFIKKNKDLVSRGVKNKGCDIKIEDVIEAHETFLSLQKETDVLRSKLNTETKKINTPKDRSRINTAKKIKGELQKTESLLDTARRAYMSLMKELPNIPSDDTPVGPDENANVVLKKVGVKPKFSFKPKSHWELGNTLDLIDKERAAIISGSRFTFLKRELVLLQFAIIQYIFSILVDEKSLKKIISKNRLSVDSTPFIPILPPVIVRKYVYESMARLNPEDDKYKLAGDEDLYLTGSAEHSMGALHMNETLNEEVLPIRYVGYSTCFRREAGSYGKDTKGILRMHQFDKVEMETFTTKEQGSEEQKFLIALQEHITQQLELPYQVVAISSGDMGGPDFKQIDIETWMPGQHLYRETNSADYVTDYQSRRLKTYVQKNTGIKELVHMNDATAATGRTLVAILENNQQKDGSITVPKVLRKHMNGIKKIAR